MSTLFGGLHPAQAHFCYECYSPHAPECLHGAACCLMNKAKVMCHHQGSQPVRDKFNSCQTTAYQGACITSQKGCQPTAYRRLASVTSQKKCKQDTRWHKAHAPECLFMRLMQTAPASPCFV